MISAHATQQPHDGDLYNSIVGLANATEVNVSDNIAISFVIVFILNSLNLGVLLNFDC
ncbi:conserved protein of unknown function [Moritella yayanosii]|uniref:Uncharacterized protein n=1 Tax=Moritella yayanosii TaxID=69539 RepID=A0A330LLB2_9GAMM|nr:conserved protein of unknown function [Moritella yayanosii]